MLEERPANRETLAQLVAFFLSDSYTTVVTAPTSAWPQTIIDRAATTGPVRWNSSHVGVLMTLLMNPAKASTTRLFLAREGGRPASRWNEALHEVTGIMFFHGSPESSDDPVDPRVLAWLRADHVLDRHKVDEFVSEVTTISQALATQFGWPYFDVFFASVEDKIADAFKSPFVAGHPYSLFVLIGEEVNHTPSVQSDVILSEMNLNDLDKLSALSTVPYPAEYYQKILTPPFSELSSAIRLSSDHTAVSWCFSHVHDLSVGLLSTEPEWRGRSFALINLLSVIQKQKELYQQLLGEVVELISEDKEMQQALHSVLAPRLVPYGYTTEDNLASRRVLQKAGFVSQQEFKWVWGEPDEVDDKSAKGV